MNIESAMWKIVTNDIHGQVQIRQKQSGEFRTVSRDALPSAGTLAAMSEKEFNRACCEAFHGH